MLSMPKTCPIGPVTIETKSINNIFMVGKQAKKQELLSKNRA